MSQYHPDYDTWVIRLVTDNPDYLGDNISGVKLYFNMFAFALGVVMSVIFTLVHNGDRASQELFINNYFGRCASTVATSIHATHVVMCGMFVRVQAGIYYYSGLTTESVIMMTYCHMVEVLWLVIMTTTMLSHVYCAHVQCT